MVDFHLSMDWLYREDITKKESEAKEIQKTSDEGDER